MITRAFGKLPSGSVIEAYVLANSTGATVEVITYGGIVRALRVPDRQGRLADVVLGFETLAPYIAGHPFFGTITGRIAGRVTGGRLQIEGRSYELARNDGANHLHGGRVGLDKRIWSAQPLLCAGGGESLRLTYRSPDGEEGYPGDLQLAVTYTLTARNEFIVETEATADRVTPLSLTHHSYFNLAGEGAGTIADHEIQIDADSIVPADESMTLTARREAVAHTASDFTRARRLGDALPLLFKAHGDLYLLRSPLGPRRTLARAARVVEPHSGRALEVLTDESCLQFYTGASLSAQLVGKSGRAYGPHAGLCLECHGYPDGASRPEFGDILVRPDQPQHRRTIYAFSTI